MKTTFYDAEGFKLGQSNSELVLEIGDVISKEGTKYTVTEIKLIRNNAGSRQDVTLSYLEEKLPVYTI